MIIQTVIELEQLQRKIENEVSYVMPVFIDQSAHPSINELSSLHILFDDNSHYCVPYNHPDAIPFSIGLTNAKKIVTLYKRDILLAFPQIDESRIDDVGMMFQLSSNAPPEIRAYYTPVIQRTLQKYNFKNLHLSIPLVKWIDCFKHILIYIRDKNNSFHKELSGYEFVNHTIIPTLTTIERSGLHVDPILLQNHFGDDIKRYIKNYMVYSEYNPYTATGRPSNARGGINFAALNKHDGTRSSFNSRFGDDGLLIQFDYEAFHLRLLANTIQYTLPSESVHTYLAQQYYGTDTITNEQYEQSKQRTFQLMYGLTDDLGNVEFFYKIREFSKKLWSDYQRQGFIRTNTGKSLILEEPSQNKVFNYWVQWLETETALDRISKVCKLLEGNLTKPILYTYDALLLDLHRSETAILPRIRALLEGTELGAGIFPTRMYKGKNYNELTLI